MTKPKKPAPGRDSGNQLNKLNDQIMYWWITKGNRAKAHECANKFERLLERCGKDDGSIQLQVHWGLLYELKGQLAHAIACREREIALLQKALRFGGAVGPINYSHLATRLQGLVDMCVEIGRKSKATTTRRKLQRFVWMHRLDLRAERKKAQEQAARTKRDAAELELERRCEHDCLPLIDRGMNLNDSGRFAAGLACFERALRISPGCPFGMYDRANTLHTLGRDDEAEDLLWDLIHATPEEMSQHCAATSFRSVQIDALFLLFRVMLYGRGFSVEAFAFAEKHLSLRRRGVRSVWSMREIRANVAAMRRAWKAGVKLTGPAPPVSDLRQFTD